MAFKKLDFFSALDTSRPRQMVDIQCDIAIMGGREVSRPYRVLFLCPQYLSTEQGIAHIEIKKREGRGASPFLDVFGL